MKLKSSDRTQFDFQAQTLCTIGESALEQIGSILSFHGVSRPLWLLPSELPNGNP
jgi:hypothetical protein